ncbi:unnamed protein product [Adineta ricciae]|nr:unnamed protein product [Adineta ricciae]
MTSPLFTFPNHQQVLGSRLSRPSFARFSITMNGNMAILTDKADVVIVPLSCAGFASQWIDITARTYVFYFEPRLCIGGTYKNQSSLGPCQICPSGTRNSGTSVNAVHQCMPCLTNSSNSFCPLAALVDVDLTNVPSYSQVVAYPETVDASNIEDLLIKNVFQIGTDKHCLLISPLLWTIIIGSLCLLFVIGMIVTNLAKCKSWMAYNQKAKIIFKHMDIIGEGEMWFGGLATLAIAILVAFSYWFSAAFIKRYPIENIHEPAVFACDESLVNSQFSTALELLAIPKSEDAQPIFDLLDKQIFVLSLELINTGFPCVSITVQENFLASKYVSLYTSCQEYIETAITSITFSLPRHLTTIQINMTGPYWIGALRLCIRGQGETNASTTLRELNFCQFYATTNQVIGRYSSIPIVFVKNINMTHALGSSDSTSYSGLWMPTFTDVSLSDEDYYVEFGSYLRYTSSMTILQITLDERPFYIKNIQQPIVRTAELVFHDLLFASLCIELFALAFLLIKLIVIPICRWFGRLCSKFLHRYIGFEHCHTFLRKHSRSNSEKFAELQENEHDKCAPSKIELCTTVADTTV